MVSEPGKFHSFEITKGMISRRAVKGALVNILIRIKINGTSVFPFKGNSCLEFFYDV